MENTSNNKFTVVGLFNDKDSAECAYDALDKRGYDKDSTDVMMSDQTRDKYYAGADAEDTDLGNKAAEGTGVGAAVGGTLGAVIAAIAAIGTSVVLPGLGLIVAGPVAAALVGAGAGGVAGGLVGALVGSGIPEEHAEAYETGIKSGGIVLRAYPKNAEDAAFIESKWESCGGEQIFSNTAKAKTATATSTSNATRRDATDGAIPVIGEVVVGKDVTEKSETITDTVRRTDVDVEKLSADELKNRGR